MVMFDPLSSHKNIKLVFVPSDNEVNPYISNTIKTLKSSSIQIYSIEQFKKISFFVKTKIIHFNWIESLNYTSKTAYYLSFIRKLTMMIILKLCRKKIIWTMHNKIQHDSKNWPLDVFMYKVCIVFSNSIIIHSTISKNILKNYYKEVNINKVFYIPHGNYLCNIDKYNVKIPDKKINFLFFGLIRPYKNIELLIEVFNNLQININIDFELKIIGRPPSDEYSFKLNELLGNTNINLIFKSLNDNELNNTIQASDIVILPYNKISSLNSGSIILAFSNKRTVIAPLIGTLEDIKEDFYYSYDYDNQESHKKNLTASILKTINDYRTNINVFNEKGEQAYRYVEKNNNWDIVRNKLLDVYNSP